MPLFICRDCRGVWGWAAPVFLCLRLCVGAWVSATPGGRMWRKSLGRWINGHSAADASNPDKAKSANSVSLILVYICLPVPAVQACPHHLQCHYDRAYDEGTAYIPPPTNPSTTPPLAFTDPISARLFQRKPRPSAVIRAHPSTPLHLLRGLLPSALPPQLCPSPCTCATLQSQHHYRTLMDSPARLYEEVMAGQLWKWGRFFINKWGKEHL